LDGALLRYQYSSASGSPSFRKLGYQNGTIAVCELVVLPAYVPTPSENQSTRID
jgi:hypothetical protein